MLRQHLSLAAKVRGRMLSCGGRGACIRRTVGVKGTKRMERVRHMRLLNIALILVYERAALACLRADSQAACGASLAHEHHRRLRVRARPP